MTTEVASEPPLLIPSTNGLEEKTGVDSGRIARHVGLAVAACLVFYGLAVSDAAYFILGLVLGYFFIGDFLGA